MRVRAQHLLGRHSAIVHEINNSQNIAKEAVITV